MTRRMPGRPSRPAVDRRKLMEGALKLLEAGGLEVVTMRALGKRLGINPMTAYHCFDNKEAVLNAAAAHHFRRFRPRLSQKDLRGRLLALGVSCGRFLQRSAALLQYLVTMEEAAVSPVEDFDRLFATALGAQRLSPGVRLAARNALADLVHGFALAGPKVSLHRLREELELLVEGIVGA